jgi:DNA-directed RNA polymerase specialized sigma24 family protein
MRRILVENARRKRSLKAGGAMTRVDLDQAALAIDPEPDDLLALEEALSRLANEDAAAADLAKLRLFAGLTVDDAAQALGISRTTGFRHWTYARAFLQAEMQADQSREK